MDHRLVSYMISYNVALDPHTKGALDRPLHNFIICGLAVQSKGTCIIDDAMLAYTTLMMSMHHQALTQQQRTFNYRLSSARMVVPLDVSKVAGGAWPSDLTSPLPPRLTLYLHVVFSTTFVSARETISYPSGPWLKTTSVRILDMLLIHMHLILFDLTLYGC
ncbi:hypothetical protein ABVT39_008264 [Epinephelus coioides]